jgi:hypothetical protein
LNGDPCTSNGECESGYCTGSWCGVQNCTSNEDCGFSSSGDLVWCGEVSGGGYGCFPGCNSSADCAAFPGSSCVDDTSINGNVALVCGF